MTDSDASDGRTGAASDGRTGAASDGRTGAATGSRIPSAVRRARDSGRRVRDHARATARIARWEVTRGVGTLDKGTVAVALVGVVLLGALAPAAVESGLALDAGLYRVGVDDDSVYRDVVASDPTLAARPPDETALREGRLDLLVRGRTVVVADDRKGRAALAELRQATKAYNDAAMVDEENQTAAFPVAVRLRYVERENVGLAPPGAGGGGSGGGGGGGGGGGDTGGDDDGGGGGDDGDGGLGAPRVGGPDLFAEGGDGTPSGISPPFPFESLVLAFLFVVPMNFVVQAYGGSVMNERVNRRGELLLVAPVGRVDVVAGKTLPYLGVILAVAAATAVAIGGGLASIAAVVPLGLLFLSLSFVAALFARSFKELTFVTVTVSVFVTAYAFVPAVFTNAGSVALISPLTLVVRDLQGQSVELGAYAFSTVGPYLTSGLLFALGTGIYREEDLFTQRPVHLKALDALASQLRGRLSVAVMSCLVVPLVFVAELLAVALLFALPIAVSLPVLLLSVVAIEEVAKSAHVYAGFGKRKFDPGLGSAVVLGVLSGAGFFVGEKLALVAQLVGLTDLTLGRAAFLTAVGSPALPAALLAAPLVLHATTAAVAAVGASRGRRPYAAALAVAVAIHLAYNLGVIAVAT